LNDVKTAGEVVKVRMPRVKPTTRAVAANLHRPAEVRDAEFVFVKLVNSDRVRPLQVARAARDKVPRPSGPAA
jgi:hypothetical protein